MSRCKSPTMYEWSPELQAALAELRGPTRHREPAPPPQAGLLRLCGVAVAAVSIPFAIAYGFEGAAVGGLLGAVTGFGAHSIVGYLRKRRESRAHEATPLFRARV